MTERIKNHHHNILSSGIYLWMERWFKSGKKSTNVINHINRIKEKKHVKIWEEKHLKTSTFILNNLKSGLSNQDIQANILNLIKDINKILQVILCFIVNVCFHRIRDNARISDLSTSIWYCASYPNQYNKAIKRNKMSIDWKGKSKISPFASEVMLRNLKDNYWNQ